MHKLAGKRVLVTAGAQGIGLAISERMIETGAHVAVHYYSSAAPAQALVAKARANGLRACAIGADLTQQTEAERLLHEVDEQLGGLDVLINNAGSLIARKSLEQVDEAFWRQVLDVNLTSCLWVTQAALPVLCRNPQSSIVNMASLAGRKGGQAGSLVYAAAKGAVLTWTRSLAGELRPAGSPRKCGGAGADFGYFFSCHPHFRGGYPSYDCRNPPGPGRLRRRCGPRGGVPSVGIRWFYLRRYARYQRRCLCLLISPSHSLLFRQP